METEPGINLLISSAGRSGSRQIKLETECSGYRWHPLDRGNRLRSMVGVRGKSTTYQAEGIDATHRRRGWKTTPALQSTAIIHAKHDPGNFVRQFEEYIGGGWRSLDGGTKSRPDSVREAVGRSTFAPARAGRVQADQG